MTMDQLRKLQLVQLEILKIVDKISKENNIRYSLYAGTLLGAVRHQGFIPWDDDLDICMPREDYDRFIKIWKNNHPKGYLMQNKDNSPGFTQTFTKIRKENSTYYSKYDIGKIYHKGIFIDIFPIDRIPEKKLDRYIYWINCAKYQLLIHEYAPDINILPVKLFCKLYLSIYSGSARKKQIKVLLKRITKYNNNTKLPVVLNESLISMKKVYPAHILNEGMTDLKFEDGYFSCFKDWDTKLSIDFGDYMTLPPESERIPSHGPVLLDFERSYEDICKGK